MKKVCPAPSWAQLQPRRKLEFEEEEHLATDEGGESAHEKKDPSVCLEVTDTHDEGAKDWNTTFLTPAKVF